MLSPQHEEKQMYFMLKDRVTVRGMLSHIVSCFGHAHYQTQVALSAVESGQFRYGGEKSSGQKTLQMI